MSEHKEQTIPELRDAVLRDLNVNLTPGNLTAVIGRGLLMLGVEIVDCLRGIEVALVEIAAAHKPVAPVAEPVASTTEPKRSKPQ